MKTLTRIMLIIALIIFGTTFIGCNNEENEPKIEKKVSIIDQIPNGIYTGYYSTENNRIEVMEKIVRNRLTARWINGAKQDLNYAPYIAGRFFKKGDNKYAQEKAIDMAMQLSEKYPCVSIIALSSIEDRNTVIYTVYYETNEPCEYEKYQK